MRIYFFGADYPPTGGGIATYSYEWIHAVSEQSKVEYVKALIFGNKNPRKEFPTKKITVQTLFDIGFLYVGYKIFRIFWRASDYNVFHALNFFPIGFWVVFWGKVFRKKTVVTFYGTDANDTSASRKTYLLKKWTLNNATKLITISNFTKITTEKKYGLNPNYIKVIHPIVPKFLLSQTDSEDGTDKIKEKYQINDDSFVIVSVHRLVKRKGTEFLIHAIAKLNDPNIKLFIIGDGKEKESLIKLTQDLKMTDRVFILGKVEDLIPYYRLANVAALVSYTIPDDGDFEGFGLVLTEAQSYGVPVIGSKSGGIPETFENGKTGLLVPERDVTAIAEAILKMKNDRVLYESMKKETGPLLEKMFGRKVIMGKYLDLLK